MESLPARWRSLSELLQWSACSSALLNRITPSAEWLLLRPDVQGEVCLAAGLCFVSKDGMMLMNNEGGSAGRELVNAPVIRRKAKDELRIPALPSSSRRSLKDEPSTSSCTGGGQGF